MSKTLFILCFLSLSSGYFARNDCARYNRVLLGLLSNNCSVVAVDLCNDVMNYTITTCDKSFCFFNNGVPSLKSCPGYEKFSDSNNLSRKIANQLQIPWIDNSYFNVVNHTVVFDNKMVVLEGFGDAVKGFYIKVIPKHRTKRNVDNSRTQLRLKTGKTPKESTPKTKPMPIYLVVIIYVIVAIISLCIVLFCVIGCVFVFKRIFGKSEEDGTSMKDTRSRSKSKKWWTNLKSIFKKKQKPKSVFSSQQISGVPFDVMAEPAPVKSVPNSKRPKSAETAHSWLGNTNEESHTSYEEALNQDVEQIDDPLFIPGFKAKGPLAPDHIDAGKFKHRGPLVLKKRQPLRLKHELTNDSYHQPKSSDHIEFDSKLNEVVDFGPGVETVISNKSNTHSCSTAPSKVVTTYAATAPATTPKVKSIKTTKGHKLSVSDRRKGARRIPPPPPPARAQPMPILPTSPAPPTSQQPASENSMPLPSEEPMPVPSSSEGQKSLKSQKTQDSQFN